MEIKESICGICNCRIKETTLFAGLTDVELDAFKDVVTTSFHPKREYVFMESDECKGLYVVRVGRVKLVRTAKNGKEQIIKILNPGDLFGLEVFSDNPVYRNSAVCMVDTDLCFIQKSDFLRIVESGPAIANKLILSLGRELNDAYERIGTLGLLNAREKMAHLLYTLAREYGKKDNGNVKLHLALSRLELAELLGITQETSIRLLKSFKDDGIINMSKKEVVIKSMDKLASIGGII